MKPGISAAISFQFGHSDMYSFNGYCLSRAPGTQQYLGRHNATLKELGAWWTQDRETSSHAVPIARPTSVHG